MHLSASYHVARAAEVPPSVRQPLSMSGRLREALGAPSNPRLRSLRPDPRAAPRAALSAPHSDPCPHRAPPTRQNNARPTPHPERTARRARHPPPHSNLRPRTRRPPCVLALADPAPASPTRSERTHRHRSRMGGVPSPRPHRFRPAVAREGRNGRLPSISPRTPIPAQPPRRRPPAARAPPRYDQQAPAGNARQACGRQRARGSSPCRATR